ncbi:MAG: hypothetical protein MZU97_17480 [Bacillus subtilis]|nr:hypothetical protein [Bacillus subtilis]
MNKATIYNVAYTANVSLGDRFQDAEQPGKGQARNARTRIAGDQRTRL